MNLRSLMPIRRDRSVARHELFTPFATLQREIDRLFDDFAGGWPTLGGLARTDMLPSMDVTETDKQIRDHRRAARARGKGRRDQLFADNVLTIRGEKKAEKEEKDKDYRLVERTYGSFARTLELPEGVNPDMINASIAKGVLTVTVPKPAPAEVKKVEVKVAA